MNSHDLKIVREALLILENELSETSNELRSFMFSGSEKQVMSFYNTINKHGIKTSIRIHTGDDTEPDDIYIAETKPLNISDYIFLEKVSSRIYKTVKE